ncbi:melanization protease 1-like, partial [Folsomia candida]|uniref:melanization protease 1-like n=1 Tax=Folsomia candida TaxID=158441 RepID=UPI0016052F6C
NLIHDAPGSSRSSGVKTPPRHHPPQDEGLIFPDAAQQRLETHSTKVGRKLLSGSSLLPSLEECGSSVKLSRHLGTFGAHPWIAILGHKDLDNGKWTHICSGTLINPKYILTSAHCLSKFPEYQITHVRLGEYDLQTEIDRGSPFLRNTIFEEHAVQRSIIHPDYQRPGRGADIALIRLKDRVSYSEFVQPICLPLRDHYAMSSYWGTSGSEPSLLVQGKLLVAGWGRLHANSTGYRTLQEAQVKITPEDECQDSNRNLFSPAKQYCVGGNYRQNICVTDDGGALILPMRLGSRATAGPTPKVFQMGIFSSGPSVTQCQTWEGMDHRLIFLRHNNRVRSALPQSVPKPTIYSKVIPHLDWMQRQLQP